ncbi:MgtC/SapB family protein [Streptomyces yangpuensis]|uniref:MgtC/SapB family protein n=1 Tax=Streptomyces yangpuensis TaxID=1648182 RepID=UPI0036594C78
MRDGRSVRGRNTAAALWSPAAVGCLAGAGLFVPAVCGTAGVVGANLLLRPLGRRLDREPRGGAEVAGVPAALGAQPGRPVPGRVTVSALLTTEGTRGRALEEAVGSLSLDPRCRRSAGLSSPHEGTTENELNTFSPAGTMDA